MPDATAAVSKAMRAGIARTQGRRGTRAVIARSPWVGSSRDPSSAGPQARLLSSPRHRLHSLAAGAVFHPVATGRVRRNMLFAGNLSTLAQSALERPSVADAGDGDDVEIQSLGRIALRYERDLAEKSIGAAVVTFGLQNLQALVVQRAAGRCLTFVGGLNRRDIGYRVAGYRDQRAEPSDRLPHRLPPSLRQLAPIRLLRCNFFCFANVRGAPSSPTLAISPPFSPEPTIMSQRCSRILLLPSTL